MSWNKKNIPIFIVFFKVLTKVLELINVWLLAL